MKMLFQKLCKLIDVKSIISLLFAACLSIGFLTNKVDVTDYLKVCIMAFTFFFTHQIGKQENEKE